MFARHKGSTPPGNLIKTFSQWEMEGRFDCSNLTFAAKADVAEIQKVWQTDKVFQPAMSTDEVAMRRSRWTEALSRSKEWEQSV